MKAFFLGKAKLRKDDVEQWAACFIGDSKDIMSDSLVHPPVSIPDSENPPESSRGTSRRTGQLPWPSEIKDALSDFCPAHGDPPSRQFSITTIEGKKCLYDYCSRYNATPEDRAMGEKLERQFNKAPRMAVSVSYDAHTQSFSLLFPDSATAQSCDSVDPSI